MKVYLIGAGPGNPDLLTIRGYRVARSADIVLCDRLIPEEMCKSFRGIRVYEIRDVVQFITQASKAGKVVAWLKNGDPLVFGGSIEICAELFKLGINCEVVPGVSSSTGVVSGAGIPLTTPETPFFTVMTAVSKGGKLIDPSVIPERGTLVIVMAGKVINELKRELLNVRSENELAAMISKGSMEEEKVKIGKVGELDSMIIGTSYPLTIVIGETIRYKNIFFTGIRS
ncbi:S-adenosyl-L-methionine-dependent uroporphyrinogen III methyltransferase [Metallosphaera sp. J1]|uniref:uroporphyrinogen-III C-methyltransferase n=1 Tax=Metallosphaera javensis (ex Hofmann et al. 2022) TaxID=99938 RepID=UPI001EDDCA3F|nr:SAM-dependent methyltransferase [Metallosphaera javensis (ex Hofmann et al. 2022)]MCG3110034.1 S-adenosyl-L-methionine-dependent uroporphyrinogen III methyltransferase [Metallosphaera javensis (ex Hofmann et al. 2022)]